MNNDCKGLEYLKHKFLSMSKAKIKEGIFVRPHIKLLFYDPTFKIKLIAVAWDVIKNVCKSF